MEDSRIDVYKPCNPTIYAYTSPNDSRLQGWMKIGYTGDEVEKRIWEQSHTSQAEEKLEWQKPAVFDDDSRTFSDRDFHAYLEKLGYERKPGTEWFKISPEKAKELLNAFRENHGGYRGGVQSYTLRKEQKEAVDKTLKYFESHGAESEFLWNAKPRFGKTLTAYSLCKKLGAKRILIITNRPVIADSWYADYAKFLGKDNYYFVSDVEELHDKNKYPYCLTRIEYTDTIKNLTGNLKEYRQDKEKGVIEFVSLQDLKGSKAFGGQYEKLYDVAKINYDILIADESHEAFDTLKTRVAFKQISRKYTLYLSGTPFKALANNRFAKDAIFNWTYADEQEAKKEWTGPCENPYADMPVLNMFAYSASSMVLPKLQNGAVNGEEFEWAFDLNELFKTSGGRFIHDSAVDRFLDLLSSDPKYPFSSPEKRGEIRHTLWLLERVESAKALEEKLKTHRVFGAYGIVRAAGKAEKEDEEKNIQKSLVRVRKAIRDNAMTITLSVGQLTTGVTVPEWSAVLMLSNLASSTLQARPERYVQAIFRAQNPWHFQQIEDRERKYFVKENAYVFDFDPARALRMYDAFANDLYSHAPEEVLDSCQRQENSAKLLEFFPVYGEDEEGNMEALDASQILSYPVKFEGMEAVRRGFRYDGLFQNIGIVLQNAAVMDIISQASKRMEEEEAEEGEEEEPDFGDIDAQGNAIPSEDSIKETEEKIFGCSSARLEFLSRGMDLPSAVENSKKEDASSLVSKVFIKPVIEAAQESCPMSKSLKNECARAISNALVSKIEESEALYALERSRIEDERAEALKSAESSEMRVEINKIYDHKQKEAENEKQQRLSNLDSEGKQIAMEIVSEKLTQQEEKAEAEPFIDKVKADLRSLASAVPTFLMAYGTYNEDGSCKTTIENLDENISEEVFREVTGISKEQFKLLRDGGDYTDPLTGGGRHFDGNVFNAPVFNTAIADFMSLRKELANWFEEGDDGDIFDYIPPQKTNQIFTPKAVVKHMVDLFEKEEPGCFANPDHTFADLYIKSGLFIAEIAKRLYRNPEMKRLFPDGEKRLDHIFSSQVFGIAPSEIIYRIATNFIFGFSASGAIPDKYRPNFEIADSAQLAKEGKLVSFVEQRFGDYLPDSYRD